MKYFYIYTVFFLLTTIVTLSANSLFDETEPEWIGTKQIRVGNYTEALKNLNAISKISDSAYHFLKLGIIYSGLKEYGRSLSYLRLCADKSELYAPYAYNRIADVELAQGRIESALMAYRVAVDKSNIQPYQYVLYRRMYAIALKYADTLGSMSWLEDVVGDDATIPQSNIKDLITNLLTSDSVETINSNLLSILDPSKYSDAQCLACSLITTSTNLDSFLSTKTLHLLSQLSSSCGAYSDASRWLQKLISKKDFVNKINQKGFLYFRTGLNYKLKNYSNVIKWGKKYNETYGHDPQIIYMIARAYRRQGNSKNATYWYDEHIKQFPHHKKTSDIIWYRAWQREDARNYTGAREYYKKMYTQHKNSSKSDDAYFRYGLSFCKEKRFNDALLTFKKFEKRYSRSTLLPASWYWRAKSHFSLNELKKAENICNMIIDKRSNDYYAWRAREMIGQITGTIVKFTYDSTQTLDQTVLWLDSLSDGCSDTTERMDSLSFVVGCRLAAVGMIDPAELILEVFEIACGHDLIMQYELARLYKLCGNPPRSYKVIRKLSWRIPESSRKNIPLTLYSILYPDFYQTTIKNVATEFSIEPELISAIMRQESMFNPQIISPVGAVGLMQIMPYTGEEIAEDLNYPYTTDSLYIAQYNIRFGAYYINKVMGMFNGDMVNAIASYNGGPHNVKRWKAQNANDDYDMFIEDIGFSETRKYVKKVLGNYFTYKALGIFSEE